MKISDDINLDLLLQHFYNKEITQRQLISYIKQRKNLQKDIIKKTNFLDIYNSDILERLYYIINNVNVVQLCPYCNKKLKFTGRLSNPYQQTCGSKECISKSLKIAHQGQKIISHNRTNEFIKWQKTVKFVNDDIIIKNIKYDKFISLITNNHILNYLDNRFNDSDSYLETIHRIKLRIEEKPKCPICGKPVTFIGRKNKIFTKYCSNSCAGKSEQTIKKKKQSLLQHWGTEQCYNSEKYKELVRKKYNVDYITQLPTVINKRKMTLLHRYKTLNLYGIKEIRQKIIKTNKAKFGYDFIFQSPTIRQKIYEKCKAQNKLGTSKAEDKIYSYFKQFGLYPERHKLNH